MSRSRKRKNKKRGNKLRYLTFAIVILAVAGLGILFYTHSFQSILLSLMGDMRGAGPPASWTATLYFGDESGRNLIKEHRIITSGQLPEQKAEALLKELLKGPVSHGTRTLPPQTRELGLKVDKAVLTVDFSPEIQKNHPGGSAAEIVTVYSVVNTLTANIPEVSRVQFLVAGKKTDNIAGHIDCRKPIAPRNDIIR